MKFLQMHNPNFEQEDRKAMYKAARLLKASLRSEIGSVFNRVSGEMEKSNVTPKFKDGVADRLVLTSPHYSFKEHYGSSKTGSTPWHQRKGGSVRGFQRHYEGMVRDVKPHSRSAATKGVRSHFKGTDYKAHNHISKALKNTNALEVLATELGVNRIVDVISQIDF